jgi:hypothetical protein
MNDTIMDDWTRVKLFNQSSISINTFETVCEGVQVGETSYLAGAYISLCKTSLSLPSL